MSPNTDTWSQLRDLWFQRGYDYSMDAVPLVQSLEECLHAVSTWVYDSVYALLSCGHVVSLFLAYQGFNW